MYDKVVEVYCNGQFMLVGCLLLMMCIELEDLLEGLIIYIGKCENVKFLCCYEKGFELVKVYLWGIIRYLEGVLIQDIYCVEFELKVKEGLLLVDLIDKWDQYFVGVYLYL